MKKESIMNKKVESIMIELVGRFNGVDFSKVSNGKAKVFMLNKCLKKGLSLNQAEAVINQVNLSAT